jgi:hypothetical protein
MVLIRRMAGASLRLTMLLILTLGGLAARPAATGAAQAEPQIGPVVALVLDNTGSGWAWARPTPQTFATSFLLRIENGAWRIAADSTSNPTLLPPGLLITRMVLSGDGQNGWAIGSISSNEDSTPALWRFQNGAWRPARNSFPPDLSLLDITMSADGSDGWMTASDSGTALSYRLLRLRNGSWNDVTPIPEAYFESLGISPDGKSGWALGLNWFEEAYRLGANGWTKQTGEALASTHIVNGLAVDNTGSGWVVGSHFRRGLADSTLTRLAPSVPPRYVAVSLPGVTRDPESELLLNTLALDGLGRGWVTGSLEQSDPQNPAKVLRLPVLLRLRGEAAAAVPPASAGLTAQQVLEANLLATSPNGAHTWLAGSTADNFGRLTEVREPWPQTRPAAAPPLPGAGVCFSAVPYCLRGVFADYWTKNGGLDQFGYPITPEVVEQQGDKTYTVQYTERARLEWHPENAPPYNVLLGLLGNTLVSGRLTEAPFQAQPKSTAAGFQWFAETQHNVGPPLLAYWQGHGGLPVFGLPRSEAFDERNAADGKVYRVQYFERNRIEYHPDNKGTKFEFLLGLLGVEQFARTYGYTP